jgi:hypothetical protein
MYGPIKQTGKPDDPIDESKLYYSRAFAWVTLKSDNDARTTSYFQTAPLRISRSEWGLFVTQKFYKGDWTNFYHTLFAVVDGKATVVWRDLDENVGSPEGKINQTWVRFWKLEGQSGLEGFSLGRIVGRGTLVDDNPDLVTTRTMDSFLWDAEAREVVEITAAMPLYAVILSTGTSHSEMEVLFGDRLRKDKCLEHFGLRPSDDYPGLKPGFSVIISLQVGKSNAERLLQQVVACDPKMSGYLKRVTYIPSEK